MVEEVKESQSQKVITEGLTLDAACGLASLAGLLAQAGIIIWGCAVMLPHWYEAYNIPGFCEQPIYNNLTVMTIITGVIYAFVFFFYIPYQIFLHFTKSSDESEGEE